MKDGLYSIGHGSRSAEDFAVLLKQYGICYLIDVRSFPYSKFHTQFRRHELDYLLQQHGIRYVFMGHLLGGRPKDPACYTDGKVNYSILKTQPGFLEGIARLKKAYSSEATVAIMCSESKPGECHRHHLIGKFLAEEGILLTHIDEKGEVIMDPVVPARLPKHSRLKL